MESAGDMYTSMVRTTGSSSSSCRSMEEDGAGAWSATGSFLTETLLLTTSGLADIVVSCVAAWIWVLGGGPRLCFRSKE